MALSKLEKRQIIEQVINFPKANLDAYFRGRFLYITADGCPLIRLEYDGIDSWYLAIYQWSTERYSKNEFGFNQTPLSLMEQLDFAVNLIP